MKKLAECKESEDFMEKKTQKIQKYLENQVKDLIEKMIISYGELTILANRENLHELMRFLRDDNFCRFSILIDICGVDYPERAKRFEVVYHLLNPTGNFRLRVKVSTQDNTTVESISDLYPAANWLERETFDMYGILFANHTDLRRILTDYDFEGYPLRKDFPLSGFVQLRYDDNQKRVVREPVDLVQGFRDFDFITPWQGSKENTQISQDQTELEKSATHKK